MKLYQYGALGLCLLVPTALMADFQYQETTQITGGSILSLMKFAGHFSKQASQANQPVVSTVYVQGNRMARVDDQQIEIIDLDKETITNIDLQKHTYTQMTFEQMRQAMQQGVQQAQAEMAKQKASAPQTAPQQPNNVDLSFKVNVRNTGANKQVNGLSANESILTMEMVGTDKTNGQQGAFAMTNDMWMVPDIPGYDELRAFNKKMAEKMGDVFSGMAKTMSAQFNQLQAQHPEAGQGMKSMMEEVTKLNGIPVEQIMRMGATTNDEPLPAASEAPLPPSNGPEMPSVGDAAKETAENTATSTANNAIASKLGRVGISGFGGFHGFGHKKQQAPPPPDNSTNAQQPTSTVFMETTTQLTSFSSAPIGSDKFAVPAGFQLVPSPQLQQPAK